jgi:hypothetical protein
MHCSRAAVRKEAAGALELLARDAHGDAVLLPELAVLGLLLPAVLSTPPPERMQPEQCSSLTVRQQHDLRFADAASC